MQIVFPPPPGFSEPFRWNGHGFTSANKSVSILAYRTAESGWTNELTAFHEETAGANHYMDVASRENAIRCLKTHLSVPEPVVMDVGCSSGMLLQSLRERLPHVTLLGADYVRAPLEALSESMPDVPLLQFDLTSCPLPDASLDAVVALNVLEHINDDHAAMRQIGRILKPGGIAVLEVPAGPHLYDIYDKELLHFRRYRISDLLTVIRSAGLEVVEHSHLGFFLYPGFAFIKKRNRRLMNIPKERQQLLVGRSIKSLRQFSLMHGIMRLEAILRRYIYYPVGIRCLVTCKKPPSKVSTVGDAIG